MFHLHVEMDGRVGRKKKLTRKYLSKVSSTNHPDHASEMLIKMPKEMGSEFSFLAVALVFIFYFLVNMQQLFPSLCAT